MGIFLKELILNWTGIKCTVDVLLSWCQKEIGLPLQGDTKTLIPPKR